MKRVVALALLACLACTEPRNRQPAGSASPLTLPPSTSQVATPSASSPTTGSTPGHTAQVTLRIARTKRGATAGVAWTAEVPVLAGLPAKATARANAVLAGGVDSAVAAGVSFEPGKGDTFELSTELSAVDARYVTVHAHGYYLPLGGEGLETTETFVFDRATGVRLVLASFFRPEALADALRVMSEVARERVPRIVGPDVFVVDTWTPRKMEAYQRITPLPEGLEVMFGVFTVVTVVVPWAVLEPYLALPPSPGPRDVPYRDGYRLTGAGLAAVVKAAKAGPLERVQEPQLYSGGEGWVLAQRGTRVIALRGPTQAGPWRVVRCASVPRDVRLSMMLRC